MQQTTNNSISANTIKKHTFLDIIKNLTPETCNKIPNEIKNNPNIINDFLENVLGFEFGFKMTLEQKWDKFKKLEWPQYMYDPDDPFDPYDPGIKSKK